MYGEALEIIQMVFEVDDEEVEGWYLQGWCFVLLGEGLGREEVKQDARDCLETCRIVSSFLLGVNRKRG
jgi:hypothetical protein